MPFRKYGRKKRTTKRRTTRKRKWKAKRRQQLLSVKTVEKIAKKVAGRLDAKQNTPLKTVMEFGDIPASTELMTTHLPHGFRVCLAGIYAANADNMRDLCWGPKCTLVEPEEDTGILLDDGNRVSDTIFLKGIRFVGCLRLPSTLESTKFHFTILRKKGVNYIATDVNEDFPERIPIQDIIASPWNYNDKADLVDGTSAYSVLKTYSFSMRQRSGRQVGSNEQRYSDLYKPVDFYHKINKKVKYVDQDSDYLSNLHPKKSDFVKPPYEFSITADSVKVLNENGQLAANMFFPQYVGRVIYYYSAT